MPTTFANLKPTNNTSYFTSLLEPLKPNCNVYSILRCSGSSKVRIRPASHPWSFKASSTYSSQTGAKCVVDAGLAIAKLDSGYASSLSLGMSSTMKSVMACPLMAI